MKQTGLSYNFSLSPSLNRLRLHRRINTRIPAGRRARIKSGMRQRRGAQRANLRRMNERRPFRFSTKLKGVTAS